MKIKLVHRASTFYQGTSEFHYAKISTLVANVHEHDSRLLRSFSQRGMRLEGKGKGRQRSREKGGE